MRSLLCDGTVFSLTVLLLTFNVTFGYLANTQEEDEEWEEEQNIPDVNAAGW